MKDNQKAPISILIMIFIPLILIFLLPSIFPYNETINYSKQFIIDILISLIYGICLFSLMYTVLSNKKNDFIKKALILGIIINILLIILAFVFPYLTTIVLSNIKLISITLTIYIALIFYIFWDKSKQES